MYDKCGALAKAERVLYELHVRDVVSWSLLIAGYAWNGQDIREVAAAKSGVFEGTIFKLDYLTKPSGLEDIGFSKKVKLTESIKPTDELVVVAYPYFNVNEMLAVEELYVDAASKSKLPIIVFDGELDRIRSGYYPSYFYQKLAALSRNFLPKFETVYYIHNFKGRYDFDGGLLNLVQKH